MEILETIYRVGVILAIFSFIWGIIKIGMLLLTGGQALKFQLLTLRVLKTVILSQVVAQFCFPSDNSLSLSGYSIVVSGLILAFYFINDSQKRKFRKFNFLSLNQKTMSDTSPRWAEVLLVCVGISGFILFVLFPSTLENGVTNWFYENIVGLEKAPIFGFIFKIIGVFFVITVINRTVQSFFVLLNGGTNRPHHDPNGNRENRKEDDFDDYEEIE